MMTRQLAKLTLKIDTCGFLINFGDKCEKYNKNRKILNKTGLY